MATQFSKSVFVTGANRGLGLEFVGQLTQQSDAPEFIFAGCRKPDDATELKKIADASEKAKVHLIKLDVCNDDEIQNAAYEVGAMLGDNGLNLLINNSGVKDSSQCQIGSLNRQKLLDSFNVNTCGPIMVAQAFVPLLEKASQKNDGVPMSIGRAAIINISMGLASLADNKTGGLHAYRCSKTALNQAGRCIGLDLAGRGIMCVNILPGYVATDMTGNKGDLTPKQSISSMLETFRKLTKEHNGGFYNRLGEQFPW